MTWTETIAQIAPMLSPIAHLPGRILMSGSDTVRQGDLYVMGLNPGGQFTQNPPVNETIGFTLVEARQCWSYLDDKPETSAASALQARVKGVLQALGKDPKSTLLTNAIFVRAADVEELKAIGLDYWQLWWALFWPIHQLLLRAVRPKLIVCFGNESYEMLRAPRPLDGGRYKRPDTRVDAADPSALERWVIDLGSGEPFETSILPLPHPSARASASWNGPKLKDHDAARLERALNLLQTAPS